MGNIRLHAKAFHAISPELVVLRGEHSATSGARACEVEHRGWQPASQPQRQRERKSREVCHCGAGSGGQERGSAAGATQRRSLREKVYAALPPPTTTQTQWAQQALRT